MDLLNTAGNWNPQLFRELKGRLKPRNITIAAALSIVGQVLLLIMFSSNLPSNSTNPIDGQLTNFYCTGEAVRYNGYVCLSDALRNWQVNWSQWWFDAGKVLTVFMLLVALIGGIYALVSDLSNEERRGTLNFIRLSPQSSYSILSGKILGTPALVYLAIGLAVPLHLWSAIVGGLPFTELLAFYVLAIATCGLFYTAALLMALASGSQAQPWLVTIAALNLGWPYIALFHGLFEPDLFGYKEPIWFFVPLFEHPFYARIFVLANCVLWTYWIWQALNRRYRNPNATLTSKKQSYWIMACAELLLMGFVLHELFPLRYPSDYSAMLYGVAWFNLLVFLVAIAVLSPTRQALQDWARYRHQQREANTGRKYSLAKDLVWGEKSPSLVAIAVNLAIVAALWIPFLLFADEGNMTKVQVIETLVLCGNLILIYAAIAQLFLFAKNKRSQAWAALALIAATSLPPLLSWIVFQNMENATAVWAMLTFGSPFLGYEHFTFGAFAIAFFGQGLILVLLISRLVRTLRKAGESESKVMMKPKS